MGQRTIQRTVEAEQLDCDLCGAVHESRDTCIVAEWEKSPRTVTEDPVTKRPIVTEAVMGDPLVLCREKCIRKTARHFRQTDAATKATW